MQQQYTFMVVDDDADGRFLLEHRLRKVFSDCAVVACTSASEALCVFRGTRVDAIITDNQLGGETGAELISHARRRGIVCPIVMVTGSDDPQVQGAAHAAGVTKVFMGGRGNFADYLRQLLMPPS